MCLISCWLIKFGANKRVIILKQTQNNTMKKLTILPLLILIISCQNQPKQVQVDTEASLPVNAFFGNKITEDGALEISGLREKMIGFDSMNLKLSATIEEVCQVKGCWMTLQNGDESMRVTFRDYGFFVPKDAMGKAVVVEGTVYMDTTSVADLKHFAEDAGKSEEEIEAITEPEIDLVFVADGVIIKDYQAPEAAEEEHEGHHHDHGEHEH